MQAVLVTGARGGMGSAVVKLLQARGFRVFALDIAACEAGENVVPVVADITSEESLQNAFQQVKSQTDTLYAILHFAGVYMLDSLVELESDAFDKIWDINLRGAYLINKIFLPLLQKDSRILITTSELAPLNPLPFTGIYAVTKAALDKYAYSLRMELQLLDIRVSVLRAGAVGTAMLGASTDALNRFCEETKIYRCNAKRFKAIVDRVEARHISPEKLAKKAAKILSKRRPSFAYKINRNPLLLLMNCLPKRLQLWLIRQILR